MILLLTHHPFQGDILFNYGCFPRTWEDPDFIHPDLREEGVGGDNDPLDVCEIGLRICEVNGGIVEKSPQDPPPPKKKFLLFFQTIP